MSSPEFIAAVQRDLERQIKQARLASIAACVKACCSPSVVDRLARALRLAPTSC